MTESLLNQTKAGAGVQAWLRSPGFDTLFFAAPAFLSSAVALIFKAQMEAMNTLPLWAWVSFVLLVDVA
ncbi:MAG: hypothetical protein K2Z81_17895, partial [Cyanobacteria bacterium]|nr:hypothetical protein [Cyanobacteriota bacterium]